MLKLLVPAQNVHFKKRTDIAVWRWYSVY